jgi:hypothetical protein
MLIVMTATRLLAAMGFAAVVLAAQPHPAAGDWLLINFTDRLEFEVSNPSDVTVDTIATLPVAPASRVALRFPGTLAIAVMLGSTPPAILPSQADDLDGDGVADEFVIPVKLGARETRTVHVYYSNTLRDRLPWPKRVHASHAYGYNRSTIALESEVIGYRSYGGFFLDIQARWEGRPGLNNSLVGYFGSGRKSEAGMDVIHLGDTLGLGGLFLRAGTDVYRPPVNMPDYAHKPAPEEAPNYRVIADGPVRAMVQASMDRWTIGQDAVRIEALYSIATGATHADARFRIAPIKVSRAYEVGTGVRDLPKVTTRSAPGRIALTGQQTDKIGPLAMALFYDPAEASAADPVMTKEGKNEAIVFREKLEPGRAASGRFAVAAAWSGSGIRDLLGHVVAVEPAARAKVTVGGFKHTKTPVPQKVEGES